MTILVAIGIWLVAMTIAVPQLLYFRTIGANDPLLNPGTPDPFDLSLPNMTGNNLDSKELLLHPVLRFQ